MASPSPLYVAARRVLLDALDALAEHRKAVILAGAQAIYVRTGQAELDVSVAPYTTDADLALDPRVLGASPALTQAMESAGFSLTIEPGIWERSVLVAGREVVVPVDLLVPEALAAGSGRRSARLPEHGRNAARRTPGLEAAVADHSDVMISSLEPEADPRAVLVPVAGSAALFVSKAHKLHERLRDAQARPSRLKPKDASDVIRLMQAYPPEQVGRRLREISADDVAGESVRQGVYHLLELFGRRRSPGVSLAVEALNGAVPEAAVRALAPAYTTALLEAYAVD
ncbi:hypothetical protein [Micromonospora carbonacea]|uniref:Nucleotidyl transferase AbiEii toxin, Type IV TA system n=1 Tax=Micromonospora carbonacea TaxID=47853 RepID=A0A7H8XS69_9ACTN|nr:hypothetical protein [Micromonospora carbonacea]MBB5823881.1 hypothetical protein [Micromonospora carbonacea]QLD27843.1 hypothetical protein HXZ27_29520 [Micromonospora carbonacea]